MRSILDNLHRRTGVLPRKVLLLVMLLLLALPTTTTEAHSLTFLLPAGPKTICLSANSAALDTLYNGVGPSDRTWVIQTAIGLWDGNTVQFVRYNFEVRDNGNSTQAAKEGAAQHDWIQVGARLQQHTLTTHVGGTMTLRVDITNADSNSQCFTVSADAGYM